MRRYFQGQPNSRSIPRSARASYSETSRRRFDKLIEEAGSGVAAVHSSRGCAFGDFDNDGDVDILVMNVNEAPSLLRNDLGVERHWLKVLLVGRKTNRSAIGSQVVATSDGRKQARTVLAQSSFYSVDDRRLHFGLGLAGTADLSIRWTSGAVENVAGVPADQRVIITEGQGITKRVPFRKS